MATLAMGFLVAGPQAVALADGEGGAAGPASGSSGPQRGQGTSRAGATSPETGKAPRASAAVRERAARTAGSAASAAAPDNTLPEPQITHRHGKNAVSPTGPAPAPAPQTVTPADPAGGQLPAAFASPLGTGIGNRPTPAASVPVAQTPAAAATPMVVAAATAPAAAPAAAGSVGSIRSAVTDVIDSGLNWLNGLSGGPVAELMSGALMLVRRSLAEAAATTSPARAVVANAQVNDTFVVTTLADAGAGSLRQAIIDANTTPGASAITFAVAGRIAVGATPLPTITDTTIIDGTTAPGYLNKPVVRVDFENTEGLTLAKAANDSEILGLALVDASGAGVTIAASDTILNGNYIGVREDGRTVEGNRGDGVLLTQGASGNIIGNLSPYDFVLANVISGNGGNGINVVTGIGNTIAANYIGTDDTGTIALGNQGNGIRLTLLSTGNLIGGPESDGNNPTHGTFVRPPQGNLISGNRSNGVLIDEGATGNQLSGNFIGTNASGNKALGNHGDGVAVVNAHYTEIIGTTSLQDPFAFYNVISGNRGNGVRVTNSDHTVVHANFLGIGADNDTIVANRGDGLLINGDSQFVDAGGEAPLGNVISGNRGYGIEIADTAGGVVSSNNFVGQAAYGTEARPNRSGGIRVTSSNPNFDRSDEDTWNRIRATLVGGNWGNGIEFLGNAHGAEVTDTSVGTDSTLKNALANRGNGIVLGGNSSQIAIGGFQPTVGAADGGFSVHTGASGGFGIVVKDNAHDNSVFNTRVGLGTGITMDTAAELPNGLGGILVGWGPSNITIGGLREAVTPGVRYGNEIVGNTGNGILAVNTTGLKVLGSVISGNRGSGVVLNGAQGAVVGSPLAGNTINDNRAYGIFAVGDLSGGNAQSSTVLGNGLTGVRMMSARGINVGGPRALEPNVIALNQAWGIFATGWSRASSLSGNIITDNASGQVNSTWAIGLLEIPPP